jgi:hypothetical protein
VGTGEFVSVSAAVTAAATGAYLAWDRVAQVLRTAAQQHRTTISGRQALGLIGVGDVAYRHDSVHALYSNQLEPHPDNLAALAAVCGKEVGEALKLSQFQTNAEVKTSIESNLFLIGAPIAEGLTQPLFGYTLERGVVDSLLLTNAPVDLPYHLVMSRSHVDTSAVARRFVAGKGMVERPNWRIEGRERFVPMTDSDRYLVDDYLLITKLRNYSSADALQSGRFIVSIEGAHGTATRGIELLLKNEQLLARIGAVLDHGAAAFQMVLRVSDLKHSPKRGTVGKKIELVAGPTVISDSDSTWREAQRIAQRNLRSWWKRQAVGNS